MKNCKVYMMLMIFAFVAAIFFPVSYVSAANSSSATKSAITSSKKKKVTKKTASVLKKKYNPAQLRLMASIINCEAGGESYQGKLAVGIVVMNRVASKDFPNTITGVIYQPYQFSPVRNGALHTHLLQYDSGKIHDKQWKDCISAAKKVLNGRNYLMIHHHQKKFSSYHFFSVYLSHARFRLGGHRFR